MRSKAAAHAPPISGPGAQPPRPPAGPFPTGPAPLCALACAKAAHPAPNRPCPAGRRPPITLLQAGGVHAPASPQNRPKNCATCKEVFYKIGDFVHLKKGSKRFAGAGILHKIKACASMRPQEREKPGKPAKILKARPHLPCTARQSRILPFDPRARLCYNAQSIVLRGGSCCCPQRDAGAARRGPLAFWRGDAVIRRGRPGSAAAALMRRCGPRRPLGKETEIL